MATSATVVSASKDQSGVIRMNFLDGSSREFPNLTAMHNFIFGDDLDPATAKNALMAEWVRLNPSCDDPTKIAGKTCVVNNQSEIPIRFV